MKYGLLITIALLCATTAPAQQRDNYSTPLDPASERREGIEAGEVLHRTFSSSEIYPDTDRDYWIYVPAAYDGRQPACLFVCLDGLQYNAPTVFDNLIADGQMPVTIGVFVNSGIVHDAEGRVLRYNRSNEFDRTDRTFSDFLLSELLPEVERQSTSDGRPVKLSQRPEDCAIAGASSGAICAFTVAWERPDRFSRVFSAVGTYVSMRGGNEYQAVIRKTEPKPLRIFLQDGVYDAWNPLFGDWYEANVLMESALNFAGYELTHQWGRGGHSNTHAYRIFPDAMRWLWKGWPRKVEAGRSLNDMLTAVLPDEGGWRQIDCDGAEGGIFAFGDGRAVFRCGGEVVAADAGGSLATLLKLKPSERLIGVDSTALYTVDARGTIVRYAGSRRNTAATGLPDAEQLVATDEGTLYIAGSRLVRIAPDGSRHTVESPCTGSRIALYPDHRLLIRNEPHTRWLWSYTVGSDGIPTAGQRFYYLHDTSADSSRPVGQMTFDKAGNLYVATATGVQICDQNGRVRAILQLPEGAVDALAIVGCNLYIRTAGGKIFVRPLKISGSQPWQRPTRPDSQGQG